MISFCIEVICYSGSINLFNLLILKWVCKGGLSKVRLNDQIIIFKKIAVCIKSGTVVRKRGANDHYLREFRDC